MKLLLILVFILTLPFAVLAKDKTTTGFNNKEKVITHTLKSISLGFDQMYYAFEGTRPADGNIYAFDDVSLDMQLLTLKYTASPFLSFSVIGTRINNYAETYFSGVLYSDRAEGMGDTLVKVTKTFLLPDHSLLIFDGGVSLPTGSINKKNANAPQFNYPYNMQLGSGTFDPLLTLMYLKHFKTKHQLGLLGLSKIRTGTNSNSYRLGNEYQGSLWYSYLWTSYLTPMAKLSFKNTQGLSGVDPLIGRNIYMEFYHNSRDYWDFTLSLNSSIKLTKYFKLQGMLALPVWQGFNNIDNVEVEAKWYGSLGLVYNGN